MSWNWYELFNLTDFVAEDLPSRTLTVLLESIGQKDILVTRGNETSILYEGTFLPVDFLGANPFISEGVGVYKDESQNIWLGVESA